ncbi:hypothetical protein WR25_11725 [Diploscapter pachys]|uniref:Cadherin domain-containing protein n=1 Tax=Diploscapter pachys TaxID=2018661 RepID=A0A2A2KPC7_9BILA|nr:hypothetical protein WR25_11725 [Diploscapter pachys]
MKIGAMPVLGTLKYPNEKRAVYKLLNMNRDFSVDPTSGIVRIQSEAKPQCSVCELIVMGTTDEGEITVARIVVKNPSFVMSVTSALTISILVLLTLIFTIILIIVCRRVHYVWRGQKRTNICWMNGPAAGGSESGMTISGGGGTMPSTTSSRYIVNADKDRYETAKSPIPKRAQGAHLVPVTVTTTDGAPTVYF